MKVWIVGAGNVGRALASALRRAGVRVHLQAARDGVGPRRIRADVLVLAVRERQLENLVQTLVEQQLVSKRTVVVHNSGSLSAEVLAPLQKICAGVAQMHPMISFASKQFFPSLERGHCHVKGDSAAEVQARKLARHLGMTPRTYSELDTVGYHAAASFVANGAAALAAIGAEILARAGVTPSDAPKMLGPLLRSVAENVEHLGFPQALTGPVRRGDVKAVERQLQLLRERVPRAASLLVASVAAQLPLARAIGDAPVEALEHLERWVQEVGAENTFSSSNPTAE